MLRNKEADVAVLEKLNQLAPIQAPLIAFLIKELPFARSYASLARQVDIPGLDGQTLATWMSGFRGNRVSPATNNLWLANERYAAKIILANIDAGNPPVNKKAQYLERVCDALDAQEERHSLDVKYNARGQIREAASTLGTHPQYLTFTGSLVRYEFEERAKQDPKDRYIQEYLEIVRAVAKDKLETPQLGRSLDAQIKLRKVAQILSEIESYDQLDPTKFPELKTSRIPNAWVSEFFLKSSSIIRALLVQGYPFTQTDIKLLKSLRDGLSVFHAPIAKDLGYGPAKVLKNLLIYGQPNDIDRNPLGSLTQS